MREEFYNMHALTAVFRITPAHAGRIGRRKIEAKNVWDHPRACGKNRRFKPYAQLAAGSPPRMREESVYPCVAEYLCGITPAHAGRMQRVLPGFCIDGDHPRACGKNRRSRMKR